MTASSRLREAVSFGLTYSVPQPRHLRHPITRLNLVRKALAPARERAPACRARSLAELGAAFLAAGCRTAPTTTEVHNPAYQRRRETYPALTLIIAQSTQGRRQTQVPPMLSAPSLALRLLPHRLVCPAVQQGLMYGHARPKAPNTVKSLRKHLSGLP